MTGFCVGQKSLVSGTVLLVLVLAVGAPAHRSERVQVECPIDEARFESSRWQSGYTFCTRLDLKRVGRIASPQPVHECPEDGYVWHSEDLTETEVDSLREWIGSAGYQGLRAESPYYRLARIYERAGRDPLSSAFAYLQASWEIETDPGQHQKYLAESHSRLVEHLEGSEGTGSSESGGAVSLQLLAAELQRRLGRFDAARSRLEKLRDDGGAETPIEKKILEYELELVARSDSAPHYVPREDMNEDRCRYHDRRQQRD